MIWCQFYFRFPPPTAKTGVIVELLERLPLPYCISAAGITYPCPSPVDAFQSLVGICGIPFTLTFYYLLWIVRPPFTEVIRYSVFMFLPVLATAFCVRFLPFSDSIKPLLAMFLPGLSPYLTGKLSVVFGPPAYSRAHRVNMSFAVFTGALVFTGLTARPQSAFSEFLFRELTKRLRLSAL